MDFRTRYVMEIITGAGFRCVFLDWYLSVSDGSGHRCSVVMHDDRVLVYGRYIHADFPDGGLGERIAYVCYRDPDFADTLVKLVGMSDGL